MNSNNENQGNNKSTIIIAILLIIAIIAVIFTAIYFKNNNANKESDNKPSPSTSPTPSPKPTELSTEVLTNYLTNVPMLLEYDPEKTFYDYTTDAYTGQAVTINDISPKLLLARAYYKTEKSFVKDPTCTGNMCSGKEVMLVKNINDTIKTMYNITSLSEESFPIIGGIVTKNGEEYSDEATRGSSNYTKVLSKIKDHKIENNTLTITEEAAFVVTHDTATMNLYKYTNTKEVVGKFQTKDEALTYLNENPSSVATFKHTFKLGSNNEYYYYSTEEVK